MMANGNGFVLRLICQGVATTFWKEKRKIEDCTELVNFTRKIPNCSENRLKLFGGLKIRAGGE